MGHHVKDERQKGTQTKSSESARVGADLFVQFASRSCLAREKKMSKQTHFIRSAAAQIRQQQLIDTNQSPGIYKVTSKPKETQQHNNTR
ncbi:hypothetical protein OUZ56_005188 [Daphnia magna]|uniref:Uncharacterized protein n=1 Tax=Daphnia magna TaxID=35525 RepID=A0ABQ9YS26_9CRUS|nr:hypothetical protein OUZ56_005188 [Daphnia magna]